MAATKLTCPDCGKVLRPAKPLPAGKKVKCPECGSIFAAQDEEEAVTEALTKKVAKSSAKTDAKTKPTAPAKKAKKEGDEKPAKKKVVKKAKDEDEDDGPMTYAYLDEGPHEEPEIDHVPDETVKDLRGPAQGIVVKPSNTMMMLCALGFISYMIFAIIILIPILFPVPAPRNADGSSTLSAREKKMVSGIALWVSGPSNLVALDRLNKDDKATASLFTMFNWDLAETGAYAWWLIWLIVGICFLGMLYCALAIYGAVRMQTLESRAWGIASSIMLMMPAISLGVFGVLSIIFTNVIGGIFDEESVYLFCPVWAIATFGSNLAVGIWGLMTLLKEEVIAGFQYVSDS